MSGSLIVTELMISIISVLCSWTVISSICGGLRFRIYHWWIELTQLLSVEILSNGIFELGSRGSSREKVGEDSPVRLCVGTQRRIQCSLDLCCAHR